MRNRIRVYLLRRMLDLKEDTDVAIVSVVLGEPVITHGKWYPKRARPFMAPDPLDNPWNPRGLIH